MVYFLLDLGNLDVALLGFSLGDLTLIYVFFISGILGCFLDAQRGLTTTTFLDA